MPNIVLAKQAAVPRAAFGGTPLAALGEGISGVLNSIASAIPDIPALPAVARGLPTFPTVRSLQLPQVPVVTEFVKSIETGLPAGLPKLGQGITGAGTKVTPAPIKAPALIFE